MRSALAIAVTFAAAACGGGGAPSSYPDAAGVAAAQAVWCKALGKVRVGDAPWEHAAACGAAYPSASSAYLRGMAKCFAARSEAEGDKAPDESQIRADCEPEASVGMPLDEEAGREVIEARCERMLRCEQVPIDECKRAVDRLENAQKVVLTSVYNRRALHEIAECLSSSGCEADEEAARAACYKPSSEKLLWFPGP